MHIWKVQQKQSINLKKQNFQACRQCCSYVPWDALIYRISRHDNFSWFYRQHDADDEIMLLQLLRDLSVDDENSNYNATS